MTIRILCTGSRSYSNRSAVLDALEAFHPSMSGHGEPTDIVVVHGACDRGADVIVDRVAHELGFTVEAHPADWNKHGKAAGFIRNGAMTLLGADLCLAFWDGKSNGTRDCFTRAVVAGIPVRIIPEKPKE